MKKTLHGYYRHYKGGLAKVIGEAKNSETKEEYIAYYHKESETGKTILWVRPKAMFFEIVRINGKEVSRFKYISNQKKIDVKELAGKVLA